MKASKSFDVALLFRALADHTRLRLLNLMGDDEVCVCFLVEALDVTQPKICRHLAYLRRAGIVTARREGKWMHYRLEKPKDPHALAILSAVDVSFKCNPRMQMDWTKLARLCCSCSVPAPLERSSKPA